MESINPDIPAATNDEVARILFQIASILEMTQDNMYRVRAYRRAALATLLLPRPLVDYIAAGVEPPLPGVGIRIRTRLRELVNTGRMGVYAALLEDLGEPMMSMLSLRGVGPRTAVRLVDELQINSMGDLAEAARRGRIRQLRGFGSKRERALGAQAEARLVDVA